MSGNSGIGVGGGGTSGPPSFNQGSTFAAGPSYGSSFAGDIIRKPSRLTSDENKGRIKKWFWADIPPFKTKNFLFSTREKIVLEGFDAHNFF